MGKIFRTVPAEVQVGPAIPYATAGRTIPLSPTAPLHAKNTQATPCGTSLLRVYTHAQLCGPARLSWRDAKEYPGVKP